jgi:uncharacterized membrane-anchored protein|tara:strand:+ start:1331 stop:1567 length:237 start_codon:yes stop_codon:yes gene_type:complete
MNYIKRLMGLGTEREDYANITSQIQKQILKKRYAEGKQNKLYGAPPKFSRSIVRYTNLTSKDTKNVILFKKKELKKFN